MPWHLPADLRHFKQVTLGKPVVMGRKTYESIGRPLPGRLNIVLSRNAEVGQNSANLKYASTVEEALILAGEADEVMIIGGEAIYQLFLSRASKVYLTYIDTELQGDAFFPPLDASWQETVSESHPADQQNPYALRFTCLERKG